ncbi:MAG: hypothetical protein COV70_03890 [Parcubacteria group bacterium CG11_big_fil_rev_8_21_14_0_20_39_22]|nr:MAG: hypothetical protein COV70_03890 [Parcubacteria group bacterium CG11_big_fil_rev_8_21_14_0_20_39_22]
MTKFAQKNRKGGFSVLELIISIAIFALITGIVLVSHSRFGGSILVTNLAYDVALSIRQAQTYGISVRGFDDNFKGVYGVHFDRSNNKEFVLFSDIEKSGNRSFQYDGDFENSCNIDGNECVKLFTIGRGNYISKFCVVNLSGVEQCSHFPAGSNNLITTMDITFMRPNPRAIIRTDKFNFNSGAQIYVSSPSGEERRIDVFMTGQISVANQ